MDGRSGTSRCITEFFSVYKAPSTFSDTVTDSREAKSTEDRHSEESDISESSYDNEDITVNDDQYDASHSGASSSTSTSQSRSSSLAPPATKRPKHSFQSKWLSTYKWLVYKDQTLFCSICLDAGMQNTYTTGTSNMRVSDIGKHGRSREHQRAIPIAEQKQAGSTTLELFERQFLEQEKAILASLTDVYWLAKEELTML